MAFATLFSLKHTISNPNNKIQIPASSRLALLSLCSTLRKLDNLRNIRIDMSLIYALEAEISEAAYKLDDMIQYYLFHRSLPPSDSLAHLQIPRVDWGDLNQEIGLFFKRAKKFEEDYNRVLRNPLRAEEEKKDGGVDFGENESTTVGLSDHIAKITNELLRQHSGPKFVSLVGMAGIGKTQIAREIARHPRIVQHFDLIAWVNASSKRQPKDILVDIIAQIEGKPRNLFQGKDTRDLSALLHKSLDGRRYLIVLDDVWSTAVTRYLRNRLPDDGDGSRVLLTTRVEEVAECDSKGIRHIPFMNNEESWVLLRTNVFGKKYCPPQLEKVGRKIAEKCEGLPLLILAVARILCEHEQQTEEFWKAVADEKTSTFTDAYDEISKVLHPSYEFLPQHLKACFLYMAVFPQTSHIAFVKLFHLWTAEELFEIGTYEPEHAVPYTFFESFTMECLRKLVSHSVVIISKHSSTEGIKSCKLHSAFWHLCSKEARRIKFFHVLKRLIHASGEDMKSHRRLSVQNNILFGMKEVNESMAAAASIARSLLCTGPDHEYEVPLCFDLVLLKVLDAAAIRFYQFPAEVLKLIRLKYLALTHHGKLPNSISDLQLLQCMIVRHHHIIRNVDPVCLPKGMRDVIRDLPEIRSIKLLGDFTSWAKQIWEEIDDIQQRWMSNEIPHYFDEKRSWCFDLLRYSSPFGEVTLRQIQKRMWDIQKACSTELPTFSINLENKIWKDRHSNSGKRIREGAIYSITLEKEIWEEMWGLQELMIIDKTFLPREIWKMQQLRHLRIIGRNLPNPSDGTKLPNLSTLYVNAHSCNSKVFKSLPSLTKLGIIIELGPFTAEVISCFKDIGLLEKLESLKCVVVNPQRVIAPAGHLSSLRLRKLSLNGFAYGRKFLSEIGSLQRLEVLKLRCAEFQEPEWEIKVGEFRSLKYLLLEDVNLVRWTIATKGCLPRLQHLIIRHCYKLKELPRPGALKKIEVEDCSPSLVASAEQARSSSVEVVITSSWKL